VNASAETFCRERRCGARVFPCSHPVLVVFRHRCLHLTHIALLVTTTLLLVYHIGPTGLRWRRHRDRESLPVKPFITLSFVPLANCHMSPTPRNLRRLLWRLPSFWSVRFVHLPGTARPASLLHDVAKFADVTLLWNLGTLANSDTHIPAFRIGSSSYSDPGIYRRVCSS